MGFWVFFSEDKVEYYDSDACELYLSPERTVSIVANSKTILDYLIVNRNIAISRNQITAQIDGGECDPGVHNKYADRSVDQAIRVLRKKLDKYGVCVLTVRGIGYKYVGPPKVDKNAPKGFPGIPPAPGSVSAGQEPAGKQPPARAAALASGADPKAGRAPSLDDLVVKLAAVLIHEGDPDHPEIKQELELEIRYIIGVLEQGLSEDFEEVCEQAWEDLSLLQKSMKIFRAYENLIDLSRTPSPTDPNTRL